jgi:hypothetical protein
MAMWRFLNTTKIVADGEFNIINILLHTFTFTFVPYSKIINLYYLNSNKTLP